MSSVAKGAGVGAPEPESPRLSAVSPTVWVLSFLWLNSIELGEGCLGGDSFFNHHHHCHSISRLQSQITVGTLSQEAANSGPILL
jgi:hypothetical protein